MRSRKKRMLDALVVYSENFDDRQPRDGPTERAIQK